jgi:hypothetical protein
LFLLVQTVEPDARLISDPAGIVPTRPAPVAAPLEVLVTVLPLDVTEVVGVRVVVVGVRVVVRVVVVLVVVRGVVAAAVGAVELAGTSVKAGCAAVSRFAS